MIFLFIISSCTFGLTVSQKNIENELNYPDASGTSKIINPFLTRITRDVSYSSNFCTLPSSEGIKSYIKVECEENCVIQPGITIEPYKIVRVNCDIGYGPANNIQYDENYICINGTWLYREPECVKLCPALKKNHLKLECFHGLEPVSCDSFMRPGTVAKFRCDDFYRPSYDTMSYSDRTTCLDGGVWSERLPTCSLVCGLVNQVNRVDASLMPANTTYREYPWHVAIYIKVFDRYEYICGGSLIAQNFVLTAAHCMFDPNNLYIKFKEADLKVAAGKRKRDYYIHELYQVNSDVKNIIVPENYIRDRTRYEEDIALLETEVYFKFNQFVLPVCLDRFGIANVRNDTKGTIAGWGLNEDGTLSDELREVRLSTMAIVRCRIFFPYFYQFLTSDKYCAFPETGPVTGVGDSGSGMTFDVFGQHYIRGIVSIKNIDFHLFYAFTNVSNYNDWIYNAIRNRHSLTISNTTTTTSTTTTTNTSPTTTTTPSTFTTKTTASSLTTTTTTSSPTTTTTTTSPNTTTTTTTTTSPTITTTPLTTTSPTITTTPLTTTPKACGMWNSKMNETRQRSPADNDNKKVEIAKPRLYKFMAFLTAFTPEDLLDVRSICGGALIAERWVLTSVSCALPNPRLGIPPKWVILGDLDILSFWDDARPQIKRIVNLFIHGGYEEVEVLHRSLLYNINNNLALVKLESPVVFDEYVAPVCLHASEQIPVQKVVLNGWNRLRRNSESLNLLVAESPVVNITQITDCFLPIEQAYSLAYSDRIICTKHRICEGKFTGAPLTFTQDGGCSYSLIGIAAYAELCDLPATYTRVSAYLPWIKSTMLLNP